MTISTHAQADAAVQRALKLFLDETDGLEDAQDYMPVVAQAQDLLGEALTFYRINDDLRKTADQLETLSAIAFRFGLDTKDAVAKLTEAADLYLRLDARQEAQDALSELIVRDPKNKTAYLAKLDDRARADETGLSSEDLMQRASAYIYADEIDKALTYYDQAIEACVAAGDTEQTLEAVLEAAEMSDQYEKDARARRYFDKAADIAQGSGSAETEAKALIRICANSEVAWGEDPKGYMERLVALKDQVTLDTKDEIEDLREMIEGLDEEGY